MRHGVTKDFRVPGKAGRPLWRPALLGTVCPIRGQERGAGECGLQMGRKLFCGGPADIFCFPYSIFFRNLL